MARHLVLVLAIVSSTISSAYAVRHGFADVVGAAIGYVFGKVAGKGVAQLSNDKRIDQGQLDHLATRLNDHLPIDIDSSTRLNHVHSGPGLRLTYHFIALKVRTPEVDTSHFRAMTTRHLRTEVCSTGVLDIFFKSGVTVSYAYNGADGLPIALINLPPTTCREPISSESPSASKSLVASPVSTDLNGKIQWLAAMMPRLQSHLPDRQMALELLKYSYIEATRAELSPQLVLAVMDVASSFQPTNSSSGMGYMRVHPKWVERIGTPSANLNDTRTNLRFGCTLLRHFLEKSNGDLTQGLALYHQGSRGVLGDTPVSDADRQFAVTVQERQAAHWNWE